MIERHAFRAMGTEIELLVDATGATAQLAAAEDEFHRLESILSRFRDDSELARLNAAGSIDAGPDLHRVVVLALAARMRTQGRFDPTIHDALVAAGYDRTFDDVPRAASAPASPGRPAAGAVRVDGARIELEAGARIDLGGIGKGYAAERAAEILATAGPCLVNAGGDIATRGGAWPVGVETSDGELTVELRDAGLATSGRDRRRWMRNGREAHHLIDPRSGKPAETDVLRVTVVAADAVEAEVAAKALFLEGMDAAAAEADELGLAAVLVGDDGRTVLAGPIA